MMLTTNNMMTHGKNKIKIIIFYHMSKCKPIIRRHAIGYQYHVNAMSAYFNSVSQISKKVRS